MSEPSRKKIFADSDAHGKAEIHYHITNLRVPLFDVDLGQALYHGNYYHLFELGREDMLRKTGFPYREFMNRQLHLSVIDAHCKYRKFLRYDDQIELHTGITALGRRSLSFSHLIYRPVEASADGEPKGLELCTECRIAMVCVHFTGGATLLPDEFREAVEAMLTMNSEQ